MTASYSTPSQCGFDIGDDGSFPALAEIVRHGVDGFLADSDEDFHNQLEKLLQTPQALGSVGKAARATVEHQYTWEQHLNRYEDLFDELICAQKRGSLLRMEARVGRPNS